MCFWHFIAKRFQQQNRTFYRKYRTYILHLDDTIVFLYVFFPSQIIFHQEFYIEILVDSTTVRKNHVLVTQFSLSSRIFSGFDEVTISGGISCDSEKCGGVGVGENWDFTELGAGPCPFQGTGPQCPSSIQWASRETSSLMALPTPWL